MGIYRIIFTALLSTATFSACNITKPLQIADPAAKQIIMKSIDAHGGLQHWKKLKGLYYTKKFSLMLENGDVEKTFNQRHDYDIANNLYIIENKNTDGSIEVTSLDNGTYTHQVDGKVTDKSTQSIQKSMNSSLYVLGIPFKLLDPGVLLQYEGKVQLEGQELYVISAEYNPATNANHSTKDIWWYYFDTSTYRVVANKVKTGDHWSWIENLTYDEDARILFNKHRRSYRIDSLGTKLYLRAEYFYDHYHLKF